MPDPNMPDIEFFWDPICPFAWITSRWITKVVAQTGETVDWRFIPLRILNKDKDYATDFPPEYPRLHGAGLRMLRVAAAIRADEGRAAMGPLYTAFGTSIWDVDPQPGAMMEGIGEHDHLVAVLTGGGWSPDYAAAADDDRWDAVLEADAEDALARTGRDVGTPIVSYRPPDGPAFFGPVISRIPDDDEAVELWQAVLRLTTWPGFAELKRSLREMPRLRALGTLEAPPAEEDWKGGRRA